MSVVIAISVVLILIGIGILGMAWFGAVNIYNGKHEWPKIVTYLFPIIIFVVSYLIMNDLTEAAMLTMIITLILMALAIAVSGMRSTFKL